jgi:hypothetical protein
MTARSTEIAIYTTEMAVYASEIAIYIAEMAVYSVEMPIYVAEISSYIAGNNSDATTYVKNRAQTANFFESANRSSGVPWVAQIARNLNLSEASGAEDDFTHTSSKGTPCRPIFGMIANELNSIG